MDYTLTNQPNEITTVPEVASLAKVFKALHGVSGEDLDVLKQQVKSLQLDAESLRHESEKPTSSTQLINVGVALAIWAIKNGQITVD